MDAVRNEVLTGRPTQRAVPPGQGPARPRRLTKWLDEYGSSASRTDRRWAWELRAGCNARWRAGDAA